MSLINKSTVTSYSTRGANVYDEFKNKSFLYGNITEEFLKQIPFAGHEKIVLDLGCGTGFGFDVLSPVLLKADIQGIGVEPAQGMLDLAKEKYGSNPRYKFHQGSFEDIPLPDHSVDMIISTLALHWVKDLAIAAKEMRRVLKDDGSLNILMIEKDDGALFKKSIVEALKKHLSFAEIMTTATLVQRVTSKGFENIFQPIFSGFDIRAVNHRDVIYGTFADHMSWWTARSTPVIAQVNDKDAFMLDLQEAMEKRTTSEGIPFDSSCLWISGKGAK